jgi:hypothetical protein
VNCESIPRLPASFVRFAIDDPRHIPYLFVWTWMCDPTIKEALRVVWTREDEWIKVTRSDGSGQRIRMCFTPLPRGSGQGLSLYCPYCGIPRRHLYGWSVCSNRVTRSLWQCRTCAGLRYRSEGNYIPRAWRTLGGYPRTKPWDPDVFSSLEQAKAVLDRRQYE